jgi:hypothetical protein
VRHRAERTHREANGSLHRDHAATGKAIRQSQSSRLEEQSESQFRAIDESAAAVKQMIATLADASRHRHASGRRSRLAEKAVPRTDKAASG